MYSHTIIVTCDDNAQDLKQARLLVVKSVNLVRKYRVFAGLMGSVVLSGSVLDKKAGVRMGHQVGCQSRARVFVTGQFQTEHPALTLIVREACTRGSRQGGWTACSLEETQNPPGRVPGLVLRGQNEDVHVAGKKATRLTASEFAAWVAKKYSVPDSTAWIKAG